MHGRLLQTRATDAPPDPVVAPVAADNRRRKPARRCTQLFLSVVMPERTFVCIKYTVNTVRART